MKKTLIICASAILSIAALSAVASNGIFGNADETQRESTIATIGSTLSSVEETQDLTEQQSKKINVFGNSIGIYRFDWVLELNRVNPNESVATDDVLHDLHKRNENRSPLLHLNLPIGENEDVLELKIGLNIRRFTSQIKADDPNESPEVQTSTAVTTTTGTPTTIAPPQTQAPTTQVTTTCPPTTTAPTTVEPTTVTPTTVAPTTATPTTITPTTITPTTVTPTTAKPTTVTPTTAKPTTQTPTTITPTTQTPTTQAPVTEVPVTTAPPSTNGAIPVTVPAMEYTEEELDLLARLIYCEAGAEPFEGQIAVGTVVLNRVASSKFPNTIHDVIYQSGQFSPAQSGTLYKKTPTQSCYDAARRCLEGERTDARILYFRATKYAPENWMNGKRKLIVVIGSQNFYS